MKSKEELNDLKNEFEALSSKPHELTEDELTEVAGGLNKKCLETESTVPQVVPANVKSLESVNAYTATGIPKKD